MIAVTGGAYRAIVQPDLMALWHPSLAHEVVHVHLLGVLVPSRDSKDVRRVPGAGRVIGKGERVAGQPAHDDKLPGGIIPCTASCSQMAAPVLAGRPKSLPSKQGLCSLCMLLQAADGPDTNLQRLGNALQAMTYYRDRCSAVSSLAGPCTAL